MNWIKGNGLRRYSKVLFLIITMLAKTGVENVTAATSESCTSNGKPYYVNGTWYSLYHTSSGIQNNGNTRNKTTLNFVGWIEKTSPYDNNKPSFPIYQPVGSSVTFDYFVDGTNSNTNGYEICWGTGSRISYWWQTGDKCSDWVYSKTINFTPNYNETSIKFGLVNSTHGAFINTIKIPLAKHIRFDDGSSCGTNNLTINCVKTSSQSKSITVKLRSFLLTNRQITIKKRSGATSFTFNTNQSTGYSTSGSDYVATINNSQGNLCGIAGATGGNFTTITGNASNYDFVIDCSNAAANGDQVIYEIYDGNGTGETLAATLTINAVLISNGTIGDNGRYNSQTPISNGSPYFVNNKWYSLYQGEGPFALDRGVNPTINVYPPCRNILTLSLAKVNYASNNKEQKGPSENSAVDDDRHFAIGDNNMTYDDNEKTQANQTTKDHIKTWNLYSDFPSTTKTANNNNWKDYTLNLYALRPSLDTSSITLFKFINRAAVNMIASNMQLELANHIKFVSSNIDESGTATAIGGYKDIDITLSSFLLANDHITVKRIDGADAFRVKNTNSVFEVADNGVVVKTFGSSNVCGITDGSAGSDYSGTKSGCEHLPGNALLIKITVRYYPSQVGNESATFAVYDGDAEGTPAATFTVTEKGADKSNSKDNTSDGTKPVYMPQQLVSGNPYKWFSIFLNYRGDTYGTKPWYTYVPLLKNDNTSDDLRAYPPCSTNNDSWVMICQDYTESSKKASLKIYTDASQTGSTYAEFYTNGVLNSWTSHNFALSSSELTSILVTRGNTSHYVYYNNFQVLLANHVRLVKSGVANGATSKDETLNTNVKSKAQCTIQIRSFLTETNLKLKLVDSDNQPSSLFRIVSIGGNAVNSTEQTEYTITDYANICGYQDGTNDNTDFDNPGVRINTNKLDIVIEYYPTCVNAEGGDKARLVFCDGTSEQADVNLTGYATKLDQTLTWSETSKSHTYDYKTNTGNVITLSQAISNQTAYDGSELQITYSSNNTTVANVSTDANGNLTMTIGNAGSATITATQAGDCAINGATTTFNVTVSPSNPNLSFTTAPLSITYHPTLTNSYVAQSAYSDAAGSMAYEIVEVESYSKVATIDASTGNVTTLKAGKFKVNATYTSTNANYTSGSVTSDVITVNRASSTLSWNTEPKGWTFNPEHNTRDCSATTSSNGGITYSVTPSEGASIADNGLLTITKADTYTVYATVPQTDQYEAPEALNETITIAKGTPNLTVSGNSSMTRYGQQTLTFETNNEDTHTITLSCGDNAFSINNHTITAEKCTTATITATIGTTDNWEAKSSTLSIEVKPCTLVFATTGNWDVTNNWNLSTDNTRHYRPDASDNVQIDVNCTIPTGVSVQPLSTTIGTNGKLVVSPSGVIKSPIFNCDDPAKLLLEADEHNQATVRFGEGTVKATVECYFKGTTHSAEGTDGKTYDNPDWQYRGFIGNGVNCASFNWSGTNKKVYIFYWDETTNATSCWNGEGKTPWYNPDSETTKTGDAWKGYSMANYGAKGNTLTYTTTLKPTSEGHTYNLSRTESGNGSSSSANCGVNLITNSWSAPIDMSSSNIQFGADIENTFYFYNTGKYDDYSSSSTIVAYPKNSGSAAQCTNCTTTNNLIPAGQSFLVWRRQVTANDANAGKLTIGYLALTANASGAMYAPEQQERFNVLGINLNNGTDNDRLALLENEHCSNAFDNGYDGTKMFQGGVPQIYATNSYGKTAVNSDITMLGQRIGYRAAADGEVCTITFETDRLTGFDELYLYDRVTRRYTDILAGESYSFDGVASGEDERFEIVGKRDDGTEFVTSSDRAIEVVGNRALLSGFAGSGETVYITDLAGNRVWSANANDGPWFDLPQLPQGLYIIYCGDVTAKYLKR